MKNALRFIFVLFLITLVFSGCSPLPSLGALPEIVGYDHYGAYSGGYYILTISCVIHNHGQGGQIAVMSGLYFNDSARNQVRSTIVYIEAGEIKTVEFRYKLDKPRLCHSRFTVRPLE